MVELFSFERMAVSPSLARAVKEFGKHGMEIIPVDRIAPSDRMRPLVGVGAHDPVICFYMGGSPLNHKAAWGNRLVHELVLTLARIESFHPDFPLKLLNGGGNAKTPYEETGLMGQCTLAMHKGGQLVRCGITENLIVKEGLPKVRGKTICLINHPGETRLGTRIDILNGMATKINLLFGGLGSSAEAATSMTETSINGKSEGRTLIVLNPVVQEWGRGKGQYRRKVRYYDHLMAQYLLEFGLGQVKESALRNLNNRVVMYNPPENANYDDMLRDMVSLNVTSFAVDREVYGDSKPEVPTALANRLCTKLSAGSKIEKPFQDIIANGDWGRALKERLGLRVRRRRPRAPDSSTPA